MASLICDIVTPTGLLFSEEIYFIAVPATQGEFGILPKRLPIMSTLKSGEIRVKREDGAVPQRFAVSGGYVESDGSKVVVLASRAADVSTLDAEEVHNAKLEAEKKLASLAADDSQAAFYRDETAWYALLERLIARR
jgi:F-type H+-transporting ATPase subunit epsilon